MVTDLRDSPLKKKRFGVSIAPLSERGVAQPGRAPALGAGCRTFESCRPDHFPQPEWQSIRTTIAVFSCALPDVPQTQRGGGYCENFNPTCSGLATLVRNDGVHYVQRHAPPALATLVPTEQAASPHCGLALRKQACYSPHSRRRTPSIKG